MNLSSIIAIYALFWILSAFLVMPWGIRNHDEMGVAKIPGQDDGAPANFNPKKILLFTTALSAVLFALYYVNYFFGWIDRHSLDWLLQGS